MKNINEILKNLSEEKQNAVKVLISANNGKKDEISNNTILAAERILRDEKLPKDKIKVQEHAKWFDTNQTYMDISQITSITKDYNLDLNQNGISDKLEINEQQDLNQNGIPDELEGKKKKKERNIKGYFSDITTNLISNVKPLEKIHDKYILPNTSEYKDFVNDIENTPAEQFYMDGERLFTEKEIENNQLNVEEMNNEYNQLVKDTILDEIEYNKTLGNDPYEISDNIREQSFENLEGLSNQYKLNYDELESQFQQDLDMGKDVLITNPNHEFKYEIDNLRKSEHITYDIEDLIKDDNNQQNQSQEPISFLEKMKVELEYDDTKSININDEVHEIYRHQGKENPFINVDLKELEKIGISSEKLLFEKNDILNKLAEGEKTNLLKHDDKEFKLGIQDDKLLVYPKLDNIKDNKLYPDNQNDLKKLENNKLAEIKINGKDYIASLDKETKIISAMKMENLKKIKEINKTTLSKEQIEKLSKGGSIIIGKDKNKVKIDFNNTNGFRIDNKNGKKLNNKINFKFDKTIQDKSFKKELKSQQKNKLTKTFKSPKFKL